METRKLGSAGPELTVIGCGSWAMGGSGQGDVNGWGPQDDRDSTAAIQAALDSGVNWFDTAPAYGMGHAEEVMGRALGNHRKDVYVATKFGLVWDESGHIKNYGGYDSVIRECEDSLRRLGTDHIDLYQMHWPDTQGTPVEESIRAVDDLIKAGKVRWAGVSNFDVPLLERAMSVRHIDSLQPKFNLFDRAIERDMLPYCRQHGIGVVAYSPLASGLLGGRYTAETTFDPSDWRAGNPDFTGEGLRGNVQRADRLKEIADRHGKTVAQLAIAWVLSTPGVTSAIVGVRRPDHIESALPAAGWTLDQSLRDEIERCLTKQTATA